MDSNQQFINDKVLTFACIFNYLAKNDDTEVVKPLEKIQSIFERYTSSYHFYLRDLRSGEEFELGTRKKYPICSCFKLAALIAYFETLRDNSDLTKLHLIRYPDQKGGGGVFPYLGGDLLFTSKQLANLMMVFSDATATSLIEKNISNDAIGRILGECTEDTKSELRLEQIIGCLFEGISGTSDRSQSIIEVGQKLVANNSYSNARDLASLVYYAYMHAPNSGLKQEYLDILKAPKFSPRTEMFFDKKVSFVGKGGSLGFGHFINDCGVVEYEGVPIAIVGYATAGWNVVREIAEVKCGQVGILVGESLGMNFSNDRWNSATEHLLE